MVMFRAHIIHARNDLVKVVFLVTSRSSLLSFYIQFICHSISAYLSFVRDFWPSNYSQAAKETLYKASPAAAQTAKKTRKKVYAEGIHSCWSAVHHRPPKIE
jgi:hypothetical protein